MELQLLPFSFPIIFSTFIFLFMVIIINILKKRSCSTLPPGPWQLPFVGNMHNLLGSLPHHALRDLAKKYGPFMYLKFGQLPTIVVSSQEFSKEVMRNHDASFASRPQNLYSEIMMYGSTDIAFAPYGEYWRQLRKLCMQELLSNTRVQSFRHIREEEMNNLIEWIASNVGKPINLSEKIKSLTYGITSRAAFGNKSEGYEEFISIVEQTVPLTAGFEFSELFPSLKFFALISPSRHKLERLKQRSEKIVERIIQEHKDQKKKKKNNESATHEDFVDVLLKFQDRSDLGFSFTIDNVKAVIWDSSMVTSLQRCSSKASVVGAASLYIL